MSDVEEMTPAQAARLARQRIREALVDPSHRLVYLEEALILLRCFEEDNE